MLGEKKKENIICLNLISWTQLVSIFYNDTPISVTYEAIFEQAYKTGILYLIVAAIWILVYYLLDTFYPRFKN